MQTVLKKIQMMFPIVGSIMSSLTPDEQNFFSWLKRNGADVSNSVGLTQFEGMGRGAVALQDIQPDTLLFSLPRSILLNTSTSSLSSQLASSSSPLSDLSGWNPLILSMMYEYLRTERWEPYFDLLPTRFDSLMFWTEQELSDLKGSIVTTKIGKEEAESAFHDELLPFVKANAQMFGDDKDYTIELFHRCGSWILSRSFHVESGTARGQDSKGRNREGSSDDEDDDEEDEEEEREDVADVAMVPMADLLNARFGCDNARLFYEPSSLNMMSTAFIAAGSQIWNTYADPPNSDLLRRYGHVDADNGADLVEIGLETVVDLVGGPEGSNLTEEKREERAEWLLEMGIEDTFIIDKTVELPEELVSTIRTFLLSTEDFAKAQRKETPPKPRFDPVSAAWAVKILEVREKEYETSIEEDEALLLRSDLPPRKRMAILVRLGEKRLLNAAKIELLAAFPPGEGLEEVKEKKDGKTKKRKGEENGSKGSKGKRSKALA